MKKKKEKGLLMQEILEGYLDDVKEVPAEENFFGEENFAGEEEPFEHEEEISEQEEKIREVILPLNHLYEKMDHILHHNFCLDRHLGMIRPLSDRF